MISVGRIGRQAAWLLAGRVAAQGLTVLLTVVIAGRLGVAGLGQYAFVAAIVYLANVVTTFGTDMVLIRDIAADGRVEGWTAALAVQLGLSAIAVGVIWLGAPLIPGQGAEVATALRLFSFSLVPAAVASISSAGLRGLGRMGRLASIGVLAAALQLAGVLLLAGQGTDLVSVVAVLLGLQFVSAGASWAVLAAVAPAFRRPAITGPRRIARMARSSAPIGVLGLLGVLYQRLGIIALTIWAGPAATGWFAGASKLVEASKAGHVALYGALYPAMAETYATGHGADRAALKATLRRSLRLSAGLAALISGGLLLVGPVAIAVLYGPSFAPSAGATAILALSIVPSTLATYRSLELVAARREDLTLRALTLSLAVLVGLLVALIPTLGWVGACWAVLTAESVQFLALTLASRGMTLHLAPRAGSASARESLPDVAV